MGSSSTGAGGGTSTSSTGSTSSAGAGGSAPAPAIKATFLTRLSAQYLSATNGGSSSLNAASLTFGQNETFTLTDVNGGSLEGGDDITLAASDGTYLSAAGGGGGDLSFVAGPPGPDETFVLVRLAGAGTVVTGNLVALETKQMVSYVSAINGGGSTVMANAPWDRSWETYSIAFVLEGGQIAPPGAAATGRAGVLSFLSGTTGKATAVGVEDKTASTPTSDSDTIAGITNLTPSFWSADWGFGDNLPEGRQTIVNEGIAQWGQGAIVQYIYHACPLSWGSNEGCAYEGGTDPIDGSFGDLTDAQWTDLTTAGGMLNGVWLARLDTIAAYFQQLKDAGVAPLFRVMHEVNGQWAWWQGRPGPTGSPLLYRITHDYLVNQKGLDNIVWVWNLQDYSTLASDVGAYNPGSSYYQVAALDVYDGGYTTANYQAMQMAAGGKPMGIAECETMITSAELAQQPLWAYAAIWPDFTQMDAPALPALYSASNVLTLGQMPGWK